MYNCRLARLTGLFKSHVDLVLRIIGSNQKDIKLFVADPFHLQLANKLSKLNQSIYSDDHPGRTLMKRTSADADSAIRQKLHSYKT